MINSSLRLLFFCLVVLAPVAGAFEYPLQFTPNPGYRGLVVAGYTFQNANVVGNCSYYTVSSTPGNEESYTRKDYLQTCTWDLHGNLLSLTPGAPAVPAPLFTKGTVTVYAMDANGDYTGTDTSLPERGFVNSPGSHYTWLTPQGNAVLSPMVYTLTATLISDGDLALNISNVTVSALKAIATLKTTDCIGQQIQVGNKCSVTVIYDPTKLPPSNTGYAKDTFRIDLTSNAGAANDFIQNFTILYKRDD